MELGCWPGDKIADGVHYLRSVSHVSFQSTALILTPTGVPTGSQPSFSKHTFPMDSMLLSDSKEPPFLQPMRQQKSFCAFRVILNCVRPKVGLLS